MIERRGRGKRILITFPKELLNRYALGEITHLDVARIVGVSGDVALRELRRVGMDTSRSTRKRLQGSRRVGVDSLDGTVTELYAKGFSLRQIAGHLKLTQEGVRQVLIRNNVLLRSRGARSPVARNDSGRSAEKKPFAERLQELREAAGLTRSQLATRCGLTRASIWSLEKTLRVPTWATLLKLSKGLGVDLQALGVDATPPDAGMSGRQAR